MRQSVNKAIDSLSLDIYRLWEIQRGPISTCVTCYMSDLLRRMLARASVIGRMHFGANEYAVSLDR